MSSSLITDLLEFLSESTSPFHAVAAIRKRLEQAGFTELASIDEVPLAAGQGYFTLRNDSSIIAVRVGSGAVTEGIRLVGAHTDSPNLSVKPSGVVERDGLTQLAVDVYGGALLNPWFDRDLSLAGRVNFLTPEGALSSCLLDFKRPVAIIPSLAIHLDREANSKRSVNAQTDILPVLCHSAPEAPRTDLHALLEAEISRQHPELALERVLDYEMSLYDSQNPGLVGLHEEFIASARLDNLLSCFAGMTAIIEAPREHWSVLVCNDHEEVGSASAVGAQGPMLKDVLEGLTTNGAASRALRDASWLLSVDNAHAVHPNFADRHDQGHGPRLNEGPVVKINRNQRYATSGEGAALIRLVAERAGVPLQSFVMRSDMACGSTIGPITATETGIKTIDIGVPTLAMHSIRELAGVNDIAHLVGLIGGFYGRVG